jgi:hypothetical protein
VYFNCVQRCQGFVTVVAVGCGPTASPSIVKRLGSSPREQQSKTSHFRADAGLVSPSGSILVLLPLWF